MRQRSEPKISNSKEKGDCWCMAYFWKHPPLNIHSLIYSLWEVPIVWCVSLSPVLLSWTFLSLCWGLTSPSSFSILVYPQDCWVNGSCKEAFSTIPFLFPDQLGIVLDVGALLFLFPQKSFHLVWYLSSCVVHGGLYAYSTRTVPFEREGILSCPSLFVPSLAYTEHLVNIWQINDCINYCMNFEVGIICSNLF